MITRIAPNDRMKISNNKSVNIFRSYIQSGVFVCMTNYKKRVSTEAPHHRPTTHKKSPCLDRGVNDFSSSRPKITTRHFSLLLCCATIMIGTRNVFIFKGVACGRLRFFSLVRFETTSTHLDIILSIERCKCSFTDTKIEVCTCV